LTLNLSDKLAIVSDEIVSKDGITIKGRSLRRAPFFAAIRVKMGRFDSSTPEECDLLLRLLIPYLDKASSGDKRREVGQVLLKELSPTSDGMVVQIIAIALKKARMRAGYKSAEQFAKKIDMHPAAYRHYERGNSQPNLETLSRICAKLGCTPNDLLTAS
jgi:DNA-binding XRE family transcriptional regulator